MRRGIRNLRVPAVLRGCIGIAVLALSATAHAQLASDEVPRDRIIPEKARLDEDLQRARLTLGPLRLIPRIDINNAGYDNNVFGTSQAPVGDWTFTVRGGLLFLVPMGRKFYFRAEALPQYTWYDKLTDRRTAGGIAEASFFAFFNRMSVALTGRTSRDFVTYSSELNTRVLTKPVDGKGEIEVDLTHRLALFGKGEYQRVRYSNEGQLPSTDVTLNDRDDSAARGGLRYRFAPDWNISTAFEQTWSDFVKSPETRNNQSRAYLVGFYFDRPTFYVNLSGGYREGRPTDSSFFPSYSTGTGSFFVSYFPIPRLEIRAYGHRGVVYSLTEFNPYFFENRIGGGLDLELHRRVLLRGFAEVGPNQYPQAEATPVGPVKRRDDVTRYGGGGSLLVTGPISVTGLVTRENYDSNIPSNTRDFTRFTVNISLGREFTR